MPDWTQIREVFDAACALPAAEREAYVSHACAGQDEVSREVLGLLAAIHETDDRFLESPVARVTGDGGLPAGFRLKSRYAIEEEIGRGGFGRVYRAADEQLPGKKVVVKVLENLAGEEWVRRRFEREIETLASIDHPGVVGIFDYGEVSGRPFLVMQYVPGQTLRSLMNDRPDAWPPQAVARLLEQLAAALEAAHAQGVCHRDLKPENIIVRNPGRRDEHAVIIDFGIATLTRPENTAATTQVAGSPDYMAPEQLLGRPSAASDIYSLGVIVFELLGGRKLHQFEIATKPEAVAAHQLSLVRDDLPEGFRAAVARAVCFDQRLRFPHVMAFSEAITQALSAPAPPARRHTREFIGVLAAVMAAALLWWQHPWSGPAKELSYRIELQHFAGDITQGAPEPFDPRTPLRAGDGLRLHVQAAGPGFVYVFNDSGDGLLTILASKSAATAGQSVQVPSGEHWLRLDGSSPREVIWLVWTAAPDPLLDRAAAYINSRDVGEIRDAALSSDIHRRLSTPQDGAIAVRQIELNSSGGKR